MFYLAKYDQINKGYQVVIRSDSKHLSEVAEGDGSVRLEPEVTVVVPRGQVTALPEELRRGWIEPHEHQYIYIVYIYIEMCVPDLKLLW